MQLYLKEDQVAGKVCWTLSVQAWYKNQQIEVVENGTKVKVNNSSSKTVNVLTTKTSARNSHSEMRMQLFASVFC